MKSLLFLMFCLVLTTLIRAQEMDTIITNDDNKIIAKVLKVTETSVEFKKSADANAALFVMAKHKIHEIRFADGTKELITVKKTEIIVMEDKPDPSFIPKRSAIKIHFFAPATDQIALSYERNISKGLNLEGSLGMINNTMFPFSISHAGSYNYSKLTQGMTAGAGIKFMLPASYTSGLNKEPLAGLYFKPELLFSTFAVRNVYSNSTTSSDIVMNSLATQLSIGSQALIRRFLTLNMNVGFGFAMTYAHYTNPDVAPAYIKPEKYQSQHYNHSRISNDLPFSMSGSLTIGVAF